MIEMRKIIEILDHEFPDYENIKRADMMKLEISALKPIGENNQITLGASNLMIYYKHKKSTGDMTNVLVFNPLTNLYMKIAIISCPPNMPNKTYIKTNGEKICFSTRPVELTNSEKASFEKLVSYINTSYEDIKDKDYYYLYKIRDLWDYFDLIDYLFDGSYKTTFGGRKALVKKGYKIYDCALIKKERRIAVRYEFPQDIADKFGLELDTKVKFKNGGVING